MNNFTQQIYTNNGINKNFNENGLKILHLGCGSSKLTNAFGIDKLSLGSVDLVHDLDKTPWPINENSYDLILAHSALEHIDNIVSFMEESWKILRNHGRIIITVPYFRIIDAFTDPTHKHFFTSESLNYFCAGGGKLENYQYSKAKFKKIGFWYGWPQSSDDPLIRLFKKFINKYPKFYDQYLSYIFPVKILVWELEKI